MLLSILKELANVKGSRFATFLYTKVPSISEKTGKVTGTLLTPETAKHTLILGADSVRLYRDDIAALTAMIPGLSGLPLDAANDLLASRENSLAAWARGEANDRYTLADTYVPLDGVPGVAVNVNDGSLVLTGLSQHKVIIGAPATYKTVNSKPLTVEKDKIRGTLPSSRIRSFRLDGVERAALNGKVYVLNDTLHVDA